MDKAIWFDLDGTLYDLYNVDGWLEMLHAEDTTAYTCGNPMHDMTAVNAVCEQLTAHGFTIGVITWTAMNGSAEFNAATAAVKKQWVSENFPCASCVHVVDYGVPKQTVVTGGILVDDNADVRAEWDGLTIDPAIQMLETLKKIVDTIN